MDYGLSFLPDASTHDMSGAEYYSSALALSRFADERGFKFVKMTEHYLHPYGGYCPNPLTFLAAIAAITNNIRLITGCLLPVFHHPIQLAAHTAMLDCMSQGRLDVGFARAYLPHEFDSFQIPLDESRARFIETILTIKRLWTEKEVSVETPFFTFNQATSLPEPYQKPHPPIWGAAVNARQSFAWIAEQGFNLLLTPPLSSWEDWQDKVSLYQEVYRDTFGGNSSYKIAISLPLLVDNDANTALKDAEKYLGRYLSTWLDAAKHWQRRHSSDYPGYKHLVKILEKTTPISMIENGQAIVGTPEQVAFQIEKLVNFSFIDYTLWQIDFGSQPYERSWRSLELFADWVVPMLSCTV